MIDPEITYRRLAAGDAGAVRERSRTVERAARSIDGAGDDVYGATGVPVWTGSGATAFQTRAARILRGMRGSYVLATTVKGALQTAADAYRDALDDADETIKSWRSRPSPMLPLVENLFAAAVDEQLKTIAKGYDEQLAAIAAVLDGDPEEVDLDALDEDTREWVEDGLEKTGDWGDGTGSTNGPLIPNTKATGDDRGLTPQGLGYDPGSGMLLQTYYKDGEPSVLSIIDPATGREVNEVVLGDGNRNHSSPVIGHAGGVTVAGDQVLVSSGGKIYSYPMDRLQNGGSGAPVQPTSTDAVSGDASYTAFHDGLLYVGDYGADTMYVYERAPGGGWQPPTDGTPPSYPTPPVTQGVVVRDGQFIFSTSPDRQSESTMIVQSHDGETLGEYDGFPNMSEGIVEVDGQLMATYESGAAQYDHFKHFWDGIGHDLWASPRMTSTPLDELGLSEEFEAEPESLRSSAGQLADPASTLRRSGGVLDGVSLPAHLLGDVPSASTLSTAVETMLGDASSSAQTAGDGTERLADALEAASRDYERTDQNVQGWLERVNPWG